MKKTLLKIAACMMILSSCGTAKDTEGPLYLNQKADIEDRIDDALSRMTLEEKIAMIHAQSKFSSAGCPRLGIPELWTDDGPHGVRPEVFWDEWSQAGWTNDSVVAFPALTCLSASWNREMSALYGKSVGEEARFREKDVLLGPGVNIYRTPLGGRNFEYMGEDPYLSSQIVVPYVKGVQSNGVSVCVKHFALNNEETWRHETNVIVSDRALYEIYLPAFKAAVQEGKCWSIMGSYNLFRGNHVCSDKVLLDDILKGEWGFDGAVISDWGGVHETDATVKHGVDLEFGTWTDGLRMGKTNAYASYFLADPYMDKIKDGTYTEKELNEKCRRVLRLIFRTAMNPDKPFGALNSEAHYAAARQIADEGIVLLKNDGDVLPIKKCSKILVVGENAVKMMTVGGGSSSLKVQHEELPIDGIKERAEKDGMEVEFARGYVGDVSGKADGVSTGQDLNESRSAEELIAEAVSMAKNADYVVFIGGLNKSSHQDCEGSDRLGLELPYNQDAVIEALIEANKNTVICLVSGNAVAMPWVEKAPSIVQTWYLGSEAGHGIADILFGDVCPSGKLPFTFPATLEDSPAHFNGKAFPTKGDNYYDEGIFVGYRWFEHKEIKPLFAFGHGLSYTTFEYGGAKVSKSKVKDGQKFTVSIPVTNTGKITGKEIVQLYVSDPECSVERPVKELKDFAKIELAPGETKKVTFTLDSNSFKFFDEKAHEWVAEPGEFDILIGASSDDIKSTCKVTLK